MDNLEAVIIGHLKHAREQVMAARGLLAKVGQMDLTIRTKNAVDGLEVLSMWIKKQEENRVK